MQSYRPLTPKIGKLGNQTRRHRPNCQENLSALSSVFILQKHLNHRRNPRYRALLRIQPRQAEGVKMNIEPASTATSPPNNNGGTGQSFNANGKRPLDEMDGGNAGSAGAAKPTSDPDVMRAYRACLHCRSRKTKCNLDANNGKPVCISLRRDVPASIISWLFCTATARLLLP